jgi:hypothetical protein
MRMHWKQELSEDLVQAMMKTDHVDPMWLRALLESVARRKRLNRPITGRSYGRLPGGTLGA